MSRRTRRLLLFGLFAGLVVALVAAWLLWPRTAITRENAAKIQKGMTLAEVETILGGRARNEATGTLSVDVADADPAEMSQRRLRARALAGAWNGQGAAVWQSDSVIIWVEFDEAEQVARAHSVPLRREPDSICVMLRRWLRL
jgi:hypothetical protein